MRYAAESLSSQTKMWRPPAADTAADAYSAYAEPATPFRAVTLREVTAPISCLPDFDFAAILIISLVCNTFRISINAIFHMACRLSAGIVSARPDPTPRESIKSCAKAVCDPCGRGI